MGWVIFVEKSFDNGHILAHKLKLCYMGGCAGLLFFRRFQAASHAAACISAKNESSWERTNSTKSIWINMSCQVNIMLFGIL